MVYSQRFVACVLVNGEPQRELANGTVPIPFGTEYALRFRNKNARRAVVQIYIDGENVSGTGYVIDPKGVVDIRRHADKDVSFKFVSLDSPEAVEHGKNGPNEDKLKGVIEARFFLEKEAPPAPKVVEHHHHHYPNYPKPWPKPYYPPYYPLSPLWQYEPTWTQHWLGGSAGSSGSIGSSFTMSNKVDDAIDHTKHSMLRCASVGTPDLHEGVVAANFMAQEAPLKDGCTVEGDLTGQTFGLTYVDLETEYTSVRLFLQGFDPAQRLVKAKTKGGLICEIKQPSKSLQDLESENEALRLKVAEMEREQLEKKLKRLSKKAKQ